MPLSPQGYLYLLACPAHSVSEPPTQALSLARSAPLFPWDPQGALTLTRPQEVCVSFAGHMCCLVTETGAMYDLAAGKRWPRGPS